MFKKLTTFLILVLGFTVSAAYQFNYNRQRETYFTFDGETSLSFASTGTYQGFLDRSVSYTDWGYYELGGATNLVSQGEDGLLGVFNTGDKIGIWVRSTSGMVYTTTRTHVAGQKFAYTGSSRQDYCIYDGHNAIGLPSHYEYQLESISGAGVGAGAGAGTGAGTGSAPSGQPLPGVLATILIGGAVLGGAKLKRRKA